MDYDSIFFHLSLSLSLSLTFARTILLHYFMNLNTRKQKIIVESLQLNLLKYFLI
jgi:hypothetical protein